MNKFNWVYFYDKRLDNWQVFINGKRFHTLCTQEEVLSLYPDIQLVDWQQIKNNR